ncbi:putative receptor-like protein kinase At5g39000 [Vicia villosa]|uniref:putative receptor-like protein kinase At5g39000 n=1 Tax=Vicia villosa TaxID=3911 RepID=UPI00273AF17C|nr:putative receptor-like protein kinase At5g39000 [Vicia villosa]
MSNSTNNIFHTKITLLYLFLLFSPLLAYSYNPDYNYAINCGNPADTKASDNRNWLGDNIHNSNIFSFIEPNSTNPSFTSQPNSLSNIQTPFLTARVSFSNFTYSFSSINTSPVFIRLHFYPTSYQNFEPSNANFSVKVNNNLTLLNNFNPLLWLHHDDEEKITKEYCIQTKPNEKLDITFVPSNINQSNVYYAFVNGIELVSMPSFLYYTDLDDMNYHIKFLGFDDSASEYQIRKDKAFETVYRVNIGDNQVPPNEDTGMFRNWDNDFPRYLEKQLPQSEPVDWGHHLNFKNNTIPNYTAPEAVYLTARSYGNYETENYNVTWNFEVDSAFTYMVRLHFCMFDLTIKNELGMVFQIFIADNLAEKRADVIAWSGGNEIPVHKDYAVPMYSLEGSSQIERVNLSIKLQRAPETFFTLYRDVFLNGIEIFKINDKSNNLAGLNPNYSSPNGKVLPTPKPNSKKSSIFMVVVVGVSCLLLAFVVVGIIVFVRRRRSFESNFEMEESLWKKKSEGSSTLPSHLCRYFTIAEIRTATNNFDDIFIIGVGGFGNVYKGYIDGVTPVAIKRLKSGSQQGVDEFLNEIELLSELRHIHLVSLIGYCNDGIEMILVYEFMQRGTLCEYLYGSDNEPLTWKQRLEILLGAARGLNYLHEGAKYNIIHRDVKSTNILLDEKWVAKVSDFGLSKVGPTGILMTHVTTVVKGSLGYLDPEYYLRQRLTLKSDVYSFGVVLLEVLCGRPPLMRCLDKQNSSLVVCFQRCYNEGVIIERLVDPFIKDSITDESLKCYCQMALNCLHDDGNQRMSMSDVVGGLELVLMLEMSEEDGKFGRTQEKKKSEKRIQSLKFTNDDGNDMSLMSICGGDYGSHTSKTSTISIISEDQPLFSANVFSEIGNQ